MPSELVTASSEMLRSCLIDNTPSPFDQDDHYGIVYRRVLEIQAEQCDAIHSLYINNFFRPAYAVLRSVLETMATLLWVSLNIDRYCQLFEDGNQPNTREILQRIGWGEEYSRTFQYLSGFVHVDMDSAEFYRNYEIGDDPSQPYPEILPDAEYYIVGTSRGTYPLSIRLMSKEEAAVNYGPYLAAKTFDIVASGLHRLYGTECYRRDWWQQQAALMFMQVCSDNPDISNRMLWSLQPKLF